VVNSEWEKQTAKGGDVMGQEPTAQELQRMYGGMMVYDRARKGSVYISKYGDLPDAQVQLLREVNRLDEKVLPPLQA